MRPINLVFRKVVIKAQHALRIRQGWSWKTRIARLQLLLLRIALSNRCSIGTSFLGLLSHFDEITYCYYVKVEKRVCGSTICWDFLLLLEFACSNLCVATPTRSSLAQRHAKQVPIDA
jgi:hypothetical protein